MPGAQDHFTGERGLGARKSVMTSSSVFPLTGSFRYHLVSGQTRGQKQGSKPVFVFCSCPGCPKNQAFDPSRLDPVAMRGQSLRAVCHARLGGGARGARADTLFFQHICQTQFRQLHTGGELNPPLFAEDFEIH